MEKSTGIGGFFGLELPEYGNFPQWHAGRSVAVNSGRRALEYILRCLGRRAPRLCSLVHMCYNSGTDGTAPDSVFLLPH